MTLEMEIAEALHESFRAALALTGSIEDAERAVTNGIISLESEPSADALLVETARSAVETDDSQDKCPQSFPVELQALFLLSSTHRYCFVLRVLMCFDLETCSEILNLSRDEVEEAHWQSLQELPRALESVRSTGRITEANVAIGRLR